MMLYRISSFLSICIVSLLLALPAAASLPSSLSPSGGGSNTGSYDTAYGGLKWTLGESLIPEVVVGYRHADVSSNGDTLGGDISIAFGVFDGFQPGKLRVKYLYGQDYLQGEAGGGYDFAANVLFAGISAQGPYSNVGVDYGFSGNDFSADNLSPYFMLNSLGIYNRPSTTPLSCPTHYRLKNNVCVPNIV